jgi:uncharacterized protein (TIGR02001 family)
MATPARAQVAVSVGVESDYRLRGYSLSAGRPTATGQIAYDDPSGFYLNASVTGVSGRDGPALLGLQGNIGYAKRLSSAVSIDGGLLRSEYQSSYSGGRPAHYTEIYLGLNFRRVTARIFYSPDYFEAGASTLYGEVEAGIQPSPQWRLNAHLGGLVYLREPTYYSARAVQYDWRLSAARQLGSLEIHATLSGGGPDKDYYAGRLRNRTALTAGASLNF